MVSQADWVNTHWLPNVHFGLAIGDLETTFVCTHLIGGATHTWREKDITRSQEFTYQVKNCVAVGFSLHVLVRT